MRAAKRTVLAVGQHDASVALRPNETKLVPAARARCARGASQISAQGHRWPLADALAIRREGVFAVDFKIRCSAGRGSPASAEIEFAVRLRHKKLVWMTKHTLRFVIAKGERRSFGAPVLPVVRSCGEHPRLRVT